VGVILLGSVALATVALGATQRSDIGRSRVIKSADQYLRVTVLAVRNPAAPTNHLSIPARGHKFVAIKLRLTNLCRCVYDDSPDNGAHIVSSTHVAYYPTRGGIDPAIDRPSRCLGQCCRRRSGSRSTAGWQRALRGASDRPAQTLAA
jgi:hypothetical protein